MNPVALLSSHKGLSMKAIVKTLRLAALALLTVACATEASAAKEFAAPDAPVSSAPSLAVGAAPPSGSDPGTLVIYAGRSESLVAPVIEQFKDENRY